jgi:hypothetical protein
LFHWLWQQKRMSSEWHSYLNDGSLVIHADKEPLGSLREVTRYGHHLNYEKALHQAVDAGSLMVCNSSGLPHSFPMGQARLDGIVHINELNRWGQSMPGGQRFSMIQDHQSLQGDLGLQFTHWANTATSGVDSPKALPEYSDSSGTTLSLQTSELAMAFGRHSAGGWGITEWKTNLEDPPGWLTSHRVHPGQRGNNGYQARWDPLAIARALIDGPCGKRPKTSVESLNSVFANEELAPWRESWRNFKEFRAERESFGK